MTEPARGGVGSLFQRLLGQIPPDILEQLTGGSPFGGGMPPRPSPTEPMPNLQTPQPTVPPPPQMPPQLTDALMPDQPPAASPMSAPMPSPAVPAAATPSPAMPRNAPSPWPSEAPNPSASFGPLDPSAQSAVPGMPPSGWPTGAIPKDADPMSIDEGGAMSVVNAAIAQQGGGAQPQSEVASPFMGPPQPEPAAKKGFFGTLMEDLGKFADPGPALVEQPPDDGEKSFMGMGKPNLDWFSEDVADPVISSLKALDAKMAGEPPPDRDGGGIGSIVEKIGRALGFGDEEEVAAAPKPSNEGRVTVTAEPAPRDYGKNDDAAAAALVKKVQGQMQAQHRSMGGEAPFELSDERMTQTMPGGPAPSAGEETPSPFAPSSEMPMFPKRLEEQRAVLEQAFGSPGRPRLSPSKSAMARKSPFDASRDEEPYMSAEALAKRLKDEHGFSVNDQFLAAAAGMLGGEDLSSGMSAMFDAIRGPRERYQKLEQELPGQYSETRVRRERDRLEDERLGSQSEILRNQDRRAQEVHEDEDVTREAAKRRDAAGAINDALLEADRLYKNGQTAEAEQRIKESIAQVQTLAQMTRSNINVNAAQIKDLEARASGTGGYAGRYDGTDPIGASNVIRFQDELKSDIENAEFPSVANPTGMKLWYAADRIGGFSEDEADRMQPYSFDAAMIKQLLLDKVPPEQIMKDYPDIEGSPLESLLRYYQEMTAAALQGQ